MAVKPNAKNTKQTPLTRVKGFGTSRSGTEHWLEQQYLSVALVPLGLYALASFYNKVLLGNGYEDAVAWLRFPPNALAMLLLLWVAIKHGSNGIQSSIVEDYIHHSGANLAATLAVKFSALVIGGAGILAVLKVFLGV